MDQQALNQAAEAGGMTLALLHKAVDCDSEGALTPGLLWISNNPRKFLELLKAEATTVAGFFRSHLAVRSIYTVLYQAELLAALLNEGEGNFIEEVFLARTPANQGWLRVAIDAGLPWDELSEMILAKLRADPSFVQQFMLYGAGGVRLPHTQPDSTYWNVLSTKKLVAAMQIVAKTAPELFFSRDGYGGESIATALVAFFDAVGEKGRAVELLAQASRHLRASESINPTALLPLEALALAQHFQDEEDRVAIMEMTALDSAALAPIFGEVSIACYQQWWRQAQFLLRQSGVVRRVARQIDRWLASQLLAKGWRVGTLREVSFMGRLQLQVVCDDVTYVMHNEQIGQPEAPHRNNRVVFRPESGTSVSRDRKVMAVNFTRI